MPDLTMTAVKTEQTKASQLHLVADDVCKQRQSVDVVVDDEDDDTMLQHKMTLFQWNDDTKTTVDSTDKKNSDDIINNNNNNNSSNNSSSDNKKKPYGGRPLRFQCPDCDRRFHAPSHLKRHRLCHTSERPFQCHICKKGFLQAWHLGRHMTIHTGNKPFRCPECPKTFGSRFEMKTHCNYIHRGIKEHECPVCKKMFTLRSNLKVHMRKHTGEKPYECHVCMKRFGQRGHLQYHLRKHNANQAEQAEGVIKKVENNNNNADKESITSDYGSEMESVLSPKSQPYPPSEERERDFALKLSSSPTPSVIHPPVNRSLSNDIPLSSRMFDHTNPREVKPFVCVTCNCGFGEISSIKAHVRHSHIKKGISNELFSCGYCSSTFRSIETLKLHFEECQRTVRSSNRCVSPEGNRDYHVEYRSGQLKRASSADYFEPAAKRRSPTTFYSPTSPGALSTSSDITFDRRMPYQKPYYYDVCPPGCTCQKEYEVKKSLATFENEAVQSRYLSYLEKYQKMLESHVQLMEAINTYRK